MSGCLLAARRKTEESKEVKMPRIKLNQGAFSSKSFISLLLCLVGLSYLTLLGSIWIDTEMRISNVIEAYSSFEFIELIEHSFKYILWFICIFTIVVGIFLLTSYPEKVKRIFAVSTPLFIVSDIGSMWFIGYSNFFAWQLYLSGFILAVSFLVMFLLIQYDLWFKKGG